MKVDADVIVVGAGPGGASAAYFLTRQGARVLVLEKAVLPRYKPCGGAVPTSVFKLFPFSFEPVIEQQITQAIFAYGQRQVTAPVMPGALTMVMRNEFDYHILSQSQAEVREGVEVLGVDQNPDAVTVTTRTGETFTARYLIAADGANSRAARSVGLRKDKTLAVAIEVEAEVDEATQARFQNRFLVGLGSLPEGYYWIFPKARHLSVGIGSLQRGEKNMPAQLAAMMNRLGVSLERGKRYAHPIPIRVRKEPLQKGRVLLIGDAAGMVDPLTGEGIRHAIESAKVASELILSGDISRYTRLMEKLYLNDLRWALLGTNIIYRAQGFSFEWLFRNQVVIEDLMKVLSSQIRYRQVISKIPLYALNFRKRLPVETIL